MWAGAGGRRSPRRRALDRGFEFDAPPSIKQILSLAAVSTRAIVIPAAPAPITQTSASIRERSVYSRRSWINSRSRSGAPRGQTAGIPSRRGANPPGQPPGRPRSPVAEDAPSKATRRRWRVSGPARTAGESRIAFAGKPRKYRPPRAGRRRVAKETAIRRAAMSDASGDAPSDIAAFNAATATETTPTNSCLRRRPRAESYSPGRGMSTSSRRRDRGLSVCVAIGLGVVFLPGARVAFSSPVSATWNRAAASPIPRFEGPSAVVNGKLYTFAGFTEHRRADHGGHQQVHVYDPGTDRWTRSIYMP